MDDLDTQVLNAALRWLQKGHTLVLATVVRTWGSAPRPPGAWMVVRDDGRVQGSVSGGCIEDDLIARIAKGEFAGGSPRVAVYGVTQDEAMHFGIPCGGTLELLLEPVPNPEKLLELAEIISTGKIALRTVDVASGEVNIEIGDAASCMLWDGRRLTTIHGPRWRLLIIGAVQISRYLASMAATLGYRVFVCDPRVEYSEEWDIPNASLVSGMPDDVVREMNLDSRSAVVALTHDPKLDDMALLEALRSQAFYVGALGSRRNSSKRRARLVEYFDFSETEVARLHGPVGIRIGSRTPPEIAVSILAELTAVKYGVSSPWVEGRSALSSAEATRVNV